MTICEQYAKDNDLKPLTDKELKKGKKKVKIYGTDDKMPWNDVYTRIRVGMRFEHINERYGNIRKIVLFAIKDGVDFEEALSEALDEKIVADRKFNNIEAVNPEAGGAMRDMVVEYAPDLKKKAINLVSSAIDRGQKIINSDDCSSNDLKNVLQAVQVGTDITDITQRHSTNVGNANLSVQVDGFDFVLGVAPEKKAIDAEIIEEDEDE